MKRYRAPQFLCVLGIVLIAFGANAATKNNGNNGNNEAEETIETEDLFGFTAGSDTEEAGETQIEFETEARFAKRDGSYTAVSKKLSLDYGLTDDLTVSLGALANYHRIRGVTDFEDVDRFSFNGIGTELRWRLAKRGPNPFGITLQLEPAILLHEESSGEPATLYGSENRLILDTELVKDRVFAAFNVIYEFERSRERASTVWESESELGFSVAAAAKIFSAAFLGAEVRYLRAYEGLAFREFTGDAFYVGPTLFWPVADNVSLSAAWSMQVSGREVGTDSRLNLADFERHQVRFKIAVALEAERSDNNRQHTRMTKRSLRP